MLNQELQWSHDLSNETQNHNILLPICSIALYVLRIFMSASGRGDSFVIGYININKYTSASENVHLCLRKNRQMGDISVATGRILSLFCDNCIFYTNFFYCYVYLVKRAVKQQQIVISFKNRGMISYHNIFMHRHNS